MTKLFCARCNKQTSFDLQVDKLEVIGTCQEQVQDPSDPDNKVACGHQVKFPGTKKKDDAMVLISKGDLASMLKSHNADNKPRLLLDEVEEFTKGLEELLVDL